MPCGRLWYLIGAMSGGDDRRPSGGGGRDVIPIDAAQRGRASRQPPSPRRPSRQLSPPPAADADTLEATSLIVNVRDVPRVTDSPSDRPTRVARRPRSEHVRRQEPPRMASPVAPTPAGASVAGNGPVNTSPSVPFHVSRPSWMHRRRRPPVWPLINRRAATAATVLLLAGLGVGAAVVLDLGSSAPRQAPSPAATDALSNTVDPVASALFADKTALVAIRMRATEQEQARAHSRARARARARAQRERAARQKRHHPAPTTSHHAVTAVALTAVTPTQSAESSSSAPTESSAPSASTSSPTSSSTGGSSSSTGGSSSSGRGSSSGGGSTSQPAPAKQQPAFGANGTLGPGSSPDS